MYLKHRAKRPCSSLTKIVESEEEVNKEAQEKAQSDDLHRFVKEYLGRYDGDRKRSGLEWFYQRTAMIAFTTSPEGFASW